MESQDFQLRHIIREIKFSFMILILKLQIQTELKQLKDLEFIHLQTNRKRLIS